jgi:hypothetical protein
MRRAKRNEKQVRAFSGEHGKEDEMSAPEAYWKYGKDDDRASDAVR